MGTTSKKHKLKLVAFVLITIAVVKAHSQVNLEKGSFNLNATDFGILDRAYSSRSIYRGSFGFGWCSPLDLKEKDFCGSLDSPFPELKLRFDAKGRITGWNKGLQEVKIKYESAKSTLPAQIQTENLTYDIVWNQERSLILRISRSPLHAIDYTYADGNLLKFSGLRPAEMKYDGNHNLIELVSSKAALRIKYNELQDVVSEIRGLGPCFESFAYTAQDDRGLRFKTEVFEVCPAKQDSPEQKVLKARMDFTYRKTKQGNLQLTEVRNQIPEPFRIRNAGN